MSRKTTVEDIIATGLAAALHMASVSSAAAGAEGAREAEQVARERRALPPWPTSPGYVADGLDD